MKRNHVLAGLVSVLVFGAPVVAPAAAAAAECRFDRRDLPLPAGVTNAMTTASSTDNSRIAAWSAQEGQPDVGLYWVDSTVHVLPAAEGSIRPTGINNTSVVVGYERVAPAWPPSLYKAFRYENGAYEHLPTEPGMSSAAVGVNDAGDVVGVMWPADSGGDRTVVVWPRTGARMSFGVGEAVGINAARQIVLKTVTPKQTAWVIDTGTGARTELPGAKGPMVLDNDRVLHYEYVAHDTYQITEWDLGGTRVGAYNRGIQPFGKNSSGTVFGEHGSSMATLWNGTATTAVVADRLPERDYYGDVTDDGTLIGTYEASSGDFRAARWLRACD